ncbi:hypothetical protein Zm00014a_034672 [Zea mays]|uniref:Disease resistance protein RPM1 n=1 Tax=Zea mays TaxID=4577 RepID=A0A3L6E8Y7_MAIZE|nr:hypothetical protein Zm00014a_034672 [Zea mays]
MEFATGALGALLPKLSMLLHGEYNLEKGVRGDIQRVMSKLERVHAALRHVGEVPVPLEQIIRPGIVNMWARDVGELSYDMEDFVDTFLVRVQGPERTSKRRYGVGTIVPTVKTLFYPRIIALNYTKATDLVGIDEAREELITRLTKEDDTSTEQRQVSIVGFGGLGKTALAKAVYNKLKAKGEFHCAAFVSMSRYPKLVEIFKELLYELDKTEYKDVISTPMEIDELINLVHEFLNKKRYLIAVDGIWDTDAWAMIRYAFPDNKLGSRIIATTRRIDVAEYVGGCCYMMKPLTREKSKILFYGRTFGSEGKCPPELSHASEKILNKCGGVPLAIITISSLLASKSKNIKEWFYLADSIGSGILERSAEMEIMWKILLRSYSDLPARLKTCLLYLSIFPEDCEIGMHRLIWRWIAEGFFDGELPHNGLFKIGESCFHELIRRSMVQPVTLEGTGLVYACRVHNMFHDLILSMSHEEQFVSVVNEKFGPLDVLSRRLAFQNIKKSQYRLVEHPRLAQSRSLNAIGCPIYAIPPIESYKSLRVLDFENCAGIEDHDLVHLGKLHHLKFLGLRNTFIGKLPEGIGNLKFLQTLDLDGTGVEELPQALHNLTELMCLIADWRTRVPNWIGNLTSLQHLVIYPERDLEILGGFPVLHSLHLLIVNTEREHVMTCGCGGFKNLKCCSITKPLKFVHGAMPRLEVLDFHFSVQLLTDSNQEFDFDFGLGNLHWLQQAIVQITALGEEVESVGRAQVALRDAIRTHLNRPTLEINLFGQTIPPELPKQDDDGAKIVEISPAESSRQAQEREKRSIDVATKKATRVPSFYTKSSIDEPMDQLINMLSVVDDEAYTKNIKILSIVRSEGLGKTTLAQKAFEELHSQFDRGAFVLLGQNPDLRRVFADILRGLDKQRFFIVFDDICDVKAWEIIKCALIENNNHSVVLTTSRNTGITEIIGGSKQLQPLSATISKNLLCKRLFGSAGKCPSELVNICDNLVEECGGILSVIDETVTLLASIPPTVENWEAVYARRMLDRSYPGLTDSLKNCLLYFTMFRRGHEISGEHLICAWIAEGFVHGQEVAETYLSDLVKKKLIDAVEVDAGGKVLTCRMYDLVHDFIVSKSIEERFVYILNDSEGRDLSEAVHVHQRLYIQGHNNKELDLQIPWLPQVKSLVSCGTAPSILKFKGLHVMDLGACESLQASHLKGINNVSSLRYLVIGGKCISGIPKEIAKLEHLRTLDLSASGLNELPEYVFMIRKLERLIVNSQMKISYGIAKMSALQELGDINVTDPELLKSLCKLTKLRVLRISIWSWDDSLKNYFKQLCDNLRSLVQCTENIQSLSIMTCCSLVFMDDLGENWTPQCLQKLEVGCSAFDILPSWFGSLSSISTLTIEVYKLSQDIIDTLGRLAGLGSLSLTSKQVPKGYFVIGSDRFNKLQSLKFVSNAMVEMFPRQQSNGTEQLKRLMIVFHASRTQDVNKDFCFGLENLSSLEHVRVEIICFDASHNMVKNAEAAVQKAISGTSIANLEIRRLQENSMTQDEADLCDAVQEQNNQKHQKMKRY